MSQTREVKRHDDEIDDLLTRCDEAVEKDEDNSLNHGTGPAYADIAAAIRWLIGDTEEHPVDD